MKFEKTFGETIHKLRKDRKLPLREVAKALNIDTSMLGKIEKNNRKPSKTLIEDISKFFDVSDRDLKIAFLSDAIAYMVIDEEENVSDVLKIAEQKIKYFKINNIH